MRPGGEPIPSCSALVAAMLLVLVGSGCSYWTFKETNRDWTRTQARILFLAEPQPFRFNGTTWYRAEATYEYYFHDGFYTGAATVRRESMSEMTGLRLRPRLDVYVDGLHPTQSATDLPSERDRVLVVLLGAGCLLFGGWMLVEMTRKVPPPAPPPDRPALLPPSGERRDFRIDRASGTLTLGDIVISPTLTWKEFTTSAHPSCLPRVMNPPWRSYAVRSDKNAVVLYFNGDRLDFLDFCLRMEGEDDSSNTDLEMQRLDLMNRWLIDEMGSHPPCDFEWGTVSASYDPRSAESSIIIKYTEVPPTPPQVSLFKLFGRTFRW